VKHLLVVAALTLAGCYSPSIRDCSVACARDLSCPAGTTCGADGLCHTEPGSHCVAPEDGPATPDGVVHGVDAPPGSADGGQRTDAPDAPGPLDARGPADAPAAGSPDATIQPDAPLQPDAPAPTDAPAEPPDTQGPPDGSGAPDVPGLPDANACTFATVGEPDDLCPGERVGPAKEGYTLTVRDHVIFPAGDVDVFQVPFMLRPHSVCPSPTVFYAVIVQLTPPPEVELELARFGIDRACVGGTERVGDILCIPFSEPCGGLPSLAPTFYFEVVGGDAAVCLPYELTIQACAAGSTCDHCIQL
jgi:hypothetical protein